MSSTYIVEPQDNSSKKDDTLIIVVNDDGTISVDQETLSNLIMNQSNANVSVVRVGQSDGDATNGDLTFTVDPPTFVPTETIRTGTQSGSTDGGLVDPFMEMDPEQLEKLETALQSEQAKQILGENVTAMLDMLTVEEQQSSIRYNIELDHCYTSRTCPSDPEPLDPLPIANSPDIDKMQYVESLPTQPTTQVVVQSRSEEPRIVQIPTPLAKKSVGRPRKIAMPVVLPSNTSKTPPTTSRPIQQETPKASPRLTEENDNFDDFSTTESSDSEPSDDDLDFGPRGPRRGGVRARGGRKGLTTRGGSMAARRGRPNKHMDVDQVRRLNIEMAAAVDAMKTPGRNDNNTPDVVTRTKRGIRTMGGKKKEEISTDSPSAIIPTPIPIEKPLQTTNQVKANLISANMIRGDMILTKPGQSRNNQKVYFVQKKVIVQPNEMKAIAPKKAPIVVTKGPMKMPYQIQTKLALSEDGKFIAISPKPAVAAVQSSQISQPEEPLQIVVPESQQLPVKLHSPKQAAISSPVKIKPILEVNKKDRKKSESESTMKITADEQQVKTIVDQKTPESAKKHVKKDLRKSPGIMADTLGPALFSTPDIIRRVGSLGEAKAPEISDTSVAMETSETKILDDKTTTSNLESSMSPMKTQFKSIAFNEMEQSTGRLFSDSSSNIIEPVQDKPGTLMETDEHDETTEPIEANENDLRSALDAGGIEGEEHLLATLEMEATKHEEELLAEALLLQEQLDVDLADPSALDGSSSAISEALLSPSAFDAALLPLSETPQTSVKISETSSDLPITFHSTSFENIKKKEAKDSKEPIQIVRGGRIITLPPIEAPATRSKRLQSKPDSPKAARTLEIHEKEEKSPKQFTPQTQIKQMDEIDSEMEDDDGEENSDSEDDPNRLWCICKRPHNNRFMICCDVCEDWFHGKCVNVTKAKAQQYEQQGKDWVCPNCRAKKKAEEPSTPKSSKTPPKKLNKSQENILTSPKTPETFQAAEKQNKVTSEWTSNIQVGSAVTQCVVCKKEARNSSIYCSDACILMHAQETLGKDKPVPSPQQKTQMKITNDSPKATPEARVIVFERRTGKVLTGSEAPTTSNLKTWLKEHPTFEIVRPNNFNTLQIAGKTVSTIPTQSGKTGKLIQQQGNSGQAKMIFTKVSGSKQTVLAPSHKKVTIVPASNVNKAQVHHVVVAPKKSPAPLKQTTLKTVPIVAKVPVTPKQPVGKKLEQKSTPSTTLKVKPSSMRKGETEPIRVTVRKTLAELLSSRIKETEDLKLSEEEIGELALKIELEMYKFFKDPGAKYKAKYRSLVFNIKDVKNLTLFRKIADKSLAPDAVVRLSAEEMASQELAEWRENETKHQLEMIKKNELDLMAQAKSIVVKTHKGELIIENEGGLGDVDPKTPVQDIVTVLNSGDNTCSDVLDEKDETTSSSLEDLKKSALKINDKKKKEREREKDGHRSREKEHKDSKRDRSSSRSQKHRNRDRSRDRRRSKDGKRDKEKVRDRDKDKVKEKSKDKERSGRSSKSRSKSSRSSHKEKEIKSEDEKMKKEVEKRKELSPVQMEKPIEERLWRHIEEETTTNIIDGNDSDVSDREPSSTVNIKTPDINEEQEKEKEITLEIEPSQNRGNNKELSTKAQTVWRGFVSMPEVAKFFITAQELSGRAKDLMADLPDTVDVVGRISHVIVWDYISKMMRTGSKEILVIRMTAANDEEKLPYITLYSYLNSRSRLGVVGSVSKNIKDFYIMPFPSHNQIPPVLASLIGPGFEENRPHLLLGIITRNKKKRVSLALPPQIVPKILKKETESRSVTPPKEKHSGSDKISHVDEQLSVTQMTLNSLNKAHVGMSRASIETAKISKIVPELSLKLDLTASPEKPTDDDDGDEPYSPGGIDGDESNDNLMKLSATTSYTATAKNPTELQRKMDELNRQIEEQKMQIQNMSSSFLESPGPTLPGLGLDPLGNDSDEAYSPSDARSFTPPPQSIPKFAQPLLDKVSDITIPPNLQEILANVKKQEFSKVDPYLPTKPGASFLTGLSTSLPRSPEKTYTPTSVSATKENTTSTLRSLSDMDLIKKAEEELAAVAAAEAISQLPDQIELPPNNEYSSFLDQPKPPGLEDEDENDDNSGMTINNDSRRNSNKFVPKSGVVLCVKRKTNDDGSNPVTPAKTPRTKSRWGQGPTAD